MTVPPGFAFRAVTIEAGIERIYNEREWRGALVVVTRGELEVHATTGDAYRFLSGSVLCLEGLPLRALRARGSEAAVLVAVSRTDEFSFRGRSKEEAVRREAPVIRHAAVTQKHAEQTPKGRQDQFQAFRNDEHPGS